MMLTNEQLRQAEQQQQALRQLVVAHDRLPDPVRTVAGVDVAYDEASNHLVAAVTVLDAQHLVVLETASFEGAATFPYVPGLFSFRELPAILRALEKLAVPPDLLVCDGQGLAHPRRFGLACHVGVATGLATIGCAKSRLLGAHAALAPTRGSQAALCDGDEIIGQVLRTQTAKNPVYVSVGHNISLATAVAWVLRLAPTYRLPETTRSADQLVRQLQRARAR
jgi:deoxyribonuclease V